MNRKFIYSLLSLLVVQAHPAAAADLFNHGNWSALAADRRASQVGDILTVLVYENATATNSASSGSKKSNKLEGRIDAGQSLRESGSIGFGGSSDNQGTTARSGRMVAQISVLVEEVLPNGDLRVSGAQNLKINRERTMIKLSGRVRLADVSTDNTVLSSRLADAQIDYDGNGYVSRSGRPGIVTRVFNWLGLM